MSQFSYEGTNRSRPLGITIIAVLLAVSAIFGICTGLATVGFAPLALLSLHVGGFFGGVFGGIFLLIMSLLELGLAGGLWGLATWAYWATVIIEVINLLYHMAGVFGRINLGFGLGSGLLALIILIYFFADGNVRRAFRV